MLSRVALLLALAAAAAAEFIVREAGVGGKVGPVLVDGASFCPSAYSSRGFAIECRDLAGPVTFFVNGSPVRTEGMVPYMIAGDSGQKIVAWNTYPRNGFAVSCRSSSGSQTINVRISCASVQAAAAALAPPVPQVAPSPPPLTMAKGNSCVKIMGDMSMGLPAGWTKDGTSIWYRRGSNDGKILAGGQSNVDFMFLAPATGTFGISVDMRTHGKTEHNDIFIQFPYGLMLKRSGSTIMQDGDAYVKAYHNVNGRAVQAWSVDNDPHAISTGSPLRAGIQYKLRLGARSTNVQIYSIIMFPCSGAGCMRGSSEWNQGLSKCS